MKQHFLYMLILGCRPKGRLTEQHDVFFGIASSLEELIPAIKRSWPEAKGILHVDAWRRVTQVGNYSITLAPTLTGEPRPQRLFFINLGGYKPGEFEEYHYKLLIVAANKGEAVQQAKRSAFYKHTGFKGAVSHVDDKYGVDVDEIYEIKDVFPEEFKNAFHLSIRENKGEEDALHIGYFKLSKLGEYDT